MSAQQGHVRACMRARTREDTQARAPGSTLKEMRGSRLAGSFSIRLVVVSTQKVPSSAARLKTQTGHRTVRWTSCGVGCVSVTCCGGPSRNMLMLPKNGDLSPG